METVLSWLRRLWSSDKIEVLVLISMSWSSDKIEVLVLISMSFQILLIFFALLRKYSASRPLSLFLWLFYLLADYVATLGLGNLLNILNNQNHSKNGYLLAFWAPFLLLHLGGPDTITAYSIEDNQLWWRHLLGLVFQVYVATSVLSLSLPSTRLWKAAIPIYIAGVLKYGERTWALRSASIDCLMDSMLPPPESDLDHARILEEYLAQQKGGLSVKILVEPKAQSRFPPSDLEPATEITTEITDNEIMLKSYQFFQTFKRLVVDLVLNFQDRLKSQSFFLQLCHVNAFKVVEIELSFMFDVLYTKASFVYTLTGLVARATSLSMIIISLVIFILSSKDGYKEADKTITYILLLVALALDMISIFLLLFSDWAFIWLEGYGTKKLFIISKICQFICRFHLLIKSRRRWSNKIYQYSLINFCLRDRHRTIFRNFLKKLNVKETWDFFQYTEAADISEDLEELIFNELKDKSQSVEDYTGYTRYNTCRGEWSLQQKGFRKDLGWSIDEAEFDESILLWHIATDICYHLEQENNDRIKDLKKISRQIACYMLYLLVQRPHMVSVGIGKPRFADICATPTELFLREKDPLKLDEASACKLLLSTFPVVNKEEGNRKSANRLLIFDACRLAHDLVAIPTSEQRWRVVSAVWVEMLSFAAIRCRGSVHARQLSVGGELLTHVWLLIAHLGMGQHYSMEASYGKPKLIVHK